ncbi:hypothetical protein CMV_021643 [Castanea mollissima]|uniref:Uncharacterized protein n=1 Tax=Castanea mollissima TaxID=60419 RepID=A0A8J4V8Y7_9ROSI|nr:hypothetical protein CMV_021643 [Castanea mollissima]
MTEEAATSLLKRGLGAVNTRLASNAFMVGHSMLLADIVTPCNDASGSMVNQTESVRSFRLLQISPLRLICA